MIPPASLLRPIIAAARVPGCARLDYTLGGCGHVERRDLRPAQAPPRLLVCALCTAGHAPPGAPPGLTAHEVAVLCGHARAAALTPEQRSACTRAGRVKGVASRARFNAAAAERKSREVAAIHDAMVAASEACAGPRWTFRGFVDAQGYPDEAGLSARFRTRYGMRPGAYFRKLCGPKESSPGSSNASTRERVKLGSGTARRA